MHESLMKVILVTTMLTMFLVGYSVPPLMEAGMIGRRGAEAPGLKSKIDPDLEKYYRSLRQE